jgi:hypothetical protein
MSINNENNDNSKNIIKLKKSETLKQNGLVTDSVYYIDTNDVKISLNHDACADIIFTIDRKKWQNNLDTMVEMAEDNGIFDKKLKQLLISHLNDNHDEILLFAANNNTNYDSSSSSKTQEQEGDTKQK